MTDASPSSAEGATDERSDGSSDGLSESLSERLPSESSPGASEESSRRSPDGAESWCVVVYVVGVMSLVLAAAQGWRLLEPPLAVDAWVRWPLLATVAAYGVPLAAIAVGTAMAFLVERTGRVVMLVGALTATALFASNVAEAALDLAGATRPRPAVVLATYDCDALDADFDTRTTDFGTVKALSCVELSWRDPAGKQQRTRFVIADDALPSEPLKVGACVRALIWPRTERLVALRPAQGGYCAEHEH